MKNPQHKISKFIILLSIHALFIFFVNTIIINILLNYYPLKELSYFVAFFTNSLFCLIFFLLMWKDLYNHNYHYFIKYNKKLVIFKNITYSILFILTGIVLIYIFDSFLYLSRIVNNYLTEIFIFLIVDSCCFILLNVIQYGWVCYMIKKRYLQQNVLIIGEPDERFPISSFFQTKINSKFYVGKLFTIDSHWYYQDTDKKQKVISSSDIPEILFKLQVGEMIIFINKKLSKEYIYKLVKYCRKNSIGYYLVPDVNKLPKIHFWAKSFPSPRQRERPRRFPQCTRHRDSEVSTILPPVSGTPALCVARSELPSQLPVPKRLSRTCPRSGRKGARLHRYSAWGA